MRIKSSLIFAGCLTFVAAGCITGGFFIIDSPFAARSEKLDQQKIVDLQSIERAINQYETKNQQLPDNLDQLRQTNQISVKVSDDEGNPYEYSRTDTTTYQLCATFDRASNEKSDVTLQGLAGLNSAWVHPPGRYCFSRTATVRALPQQTRVIISTPQPPPPPTTTNVVQKIESSTTPICKTRDLPAGSPPDATSFHGCAIFGGSTNGICNDNPTWSNGQSWTPPTGVKTFYVLAVGGGGGGGANSVRGMGGSGGGSGEVVTATLPYDGTPIPVQVGFGGLAGQTFMRPGSPGGISMFGTVIAAGGYGGTQNGGGAGGFGHKGGSNGGGGTGGGNYVSGYHGGAGGDGGTGGSNGLAGSAGTDVPSPVPGTPGGASNPFPSLCFIQTSISAGKGGMGGSYGAPATGCGGGGGGGGGGIAINGTGPVAATGFSAPPGINQAQGGAGGSGYGAGGGGAANYQFGAQSYGGNGAAGVIYVEW